MNKLKKGSFRTDVVIIGGGAAGLAAAVAASEAECTGITVLEAKKSTGGNGIFPVGIFAADSELQHRMGIDAGTDALFERAMEYAHWKTDGRIIRALLEKSGDTIRWLETKGVTFERLVHHFPNQTPEVFHLVPATQRTGAEVTKALQKCCSDSGIRVLTQTRAKKILTDNNGKVVGVLADDNKQELHVRTNCVVIATGGFAGDSRLVKKYFPSYDETEILHLMGIRHKGDGLRLAVAAGAVPGDDIVLEMGAPKYAGPPGISVLISKPQTLWVNKRGERFADESIAFLFSESANIICQQPGKVCFVLLDENIKRRIIAGGLDPLESLTIPKSWQASLDADIKSQSGKTVKTAKNWGEIADWVGVPLEVLKGTIAEYNACCERGHDDIFAKDRRYLLPLNTPPFYTIKTGVDLLTTHGGIIVDSNMRVLDKESQAISGLFAAGVDISGTDADTYNLNLSGHAFGFSINSGRIAGENAAKYAVSLHKQQECSVGAVSVQYGGKDKDRVATRRIR